MNYPRCPCGSVIAVQSKSGKCAPCRIWNAHRLPAQLHDAVAHVEAHGALPPLLRGISGGTTR